SSCSLHGLAGFFGSCVRFWGLFQPLPLASSISSSGRCLGRHLNQSPGSAMKPVVMPPAVRNLEGIMRNLALSLLLMLFPCVAAAEELEDSTTAVERAGKVVQKANTGDVRGGL